MLDTAYLQPVNSCYYNYCTINLVCIPDEVCCFWHCSTSLSYELIGMTRCPWEIQYQLGVATVDVQYVAMYARHMLLAQWGEPEAS